MDNNKAKFIEVFSGTLWESEMVKSLLQDAEIESFLQNTNLNTYIYEPVQALGVKVLILSSVYEKSREIVDNYFRNLNNDSISEER